VCLRPVRAGHCPAHGPWRAHQLLTRGDRRRAAARRWGEFRPLAQACPRCLGEVAAFRDRFDCLRPGHGRDPHGPYRVDELLGPTAQRESARTRMRLARRERARARPVALPSFALEERTVRLAGGAAVVVATLAYLMR
jgi:hypothetical protein